MRCSNGRFFPKSDDESSYGLAENKREFKRGYGGVVQRETDASVEEELQKRSDASMLSCGARESLGRINQPGPRQSRGGYDAES
jgi:hypothetical protein